MAGYIITGNPAEVAKVIQENRIRQNRGVLVFTPITEEADDRSEEIAELRRRIAELEARLADDKSVDEPTDDKSVESDADFKEVDIDDVKEAPAAETKKTKRTKKQE